LIKTFEIIPQSVVELADKPGVAFIIAL